jgi:two-component system, NarL family, sensor histidine kinase DesK
VTTPQPPTVRQATWLVAVLHVPIVAVPVLFTALGTAGLPRAPHALAAVPMGLALLALQLRHSLAATRDRRPAGWAWTLAATAALAYGPFPLPEWREFWLSAAWCPMASVLLLLRGRTRVGVFAVLAAGNLAVYVTDRAPGVELAYYALYGLVSVVPPLVLVGAVRLTRVLDELHARRDELASLAVARERLRLSQDLHDVLGQNLVAVSLQGELALRLLRKDPCTARARVEEVTALARKTLRGVRAVTYDRHRVSLPAEVDGAAALLAAAGIEVAVDVDDADLPAGDAEVFAWAVREGTTNVLRHSDARWCSIAARRQDDGTARLVVRNDGAHPPGAGAGNGLTGLAARAGERHGRAHGVRLDGDVFELVVELPGEAR